MLAKTKTSRKKIIFYALIIAVMLLGNVYIYYSSKSSDIDAVGGIDSVIAEVEKSVSVKDGQQKTLSETVLENNVFKTLKKIGDWPVVPKNVGKADPFAPFLEE